MKAIACVTRNNGIGLNGSSYFVNMLERDW